MPVSSELVTPIVIGEKLYHCCSFRDIITADVGEFIRVDGTRVRGSTEWQRVPPLTAAKKLPVVPHGADTLQSISPSSRRRPVRKC